MGCKYVTQKGVSKLPFCSAIYIFAEFVRYAIKDMIVFHLVILLRRVVYIDKLNVDTKMTVQMFS